jgi:hypothetical protein
VDLDDVGVAVVGKVPRVFEHVRLGHDFALTPGEVLDDRELLGGQIDRSARRATVRAAGSITRSPTLMLAGRSSAPRRSKARRCATSTT